MIGTIDALDKLTKIVDEIDPNAHARATARAATGWTLGRSLAHCAQSLEYSLTAYPKLRSSLFRATVGPLVKRRFIKAGKMSHDLEAAIAGAPELAADLDAAEAKARLRRAIDAFRAYDGPLAPHLAYGPCTKAEYAVLHLLHVEDHLRPFASAR